MTLGQMVGFVLGEELGDEVGAGGGKKVGVYFNIFS